MGIRVGIKKGGCAGMEYTIDLVTEPNAKDDLIERDGAKVWIEPSAVLYLLGTEMDFEVDDAALGFHLHQSEPDVGLRLRRVRRAEARRSRGACSARRCSGDGALIAHSHGFCRRPPFPAAFFRCHGSPSG